jgi:hypothetical protein
MHVQRRVMVQLPDDRLTGMFEIVVTENVESTEVEET